MGYEMESGRFELNTWGSFFYVTQFSDCGREVAVWKFYDKDVAEKFFNLARVYYMRDNLSEREKQLA